MSVSWNGGASSRITCTATMQPAIIRIDSVRSAASATR